MGESKTTNTPYDDVFRTLLNDCSSLILPVINEVFGEHYSGNEEIRFSVNEHFLNRQDGKEEERITDSSFQVLGEKKGKYHLECQSSGDNSILIRFFEYDTQIALDEGEVKGNVLTVAFPHSAVLYLRSNWNTPEELTVRMETPGGSLAYEIPVMKVQQYTIEEIFEKNLLFLIPFYIFTHEKRFSEYERDRERLEQIKQEYDRIKEKLEERLEQGVISEYIKCTIIDMSTKVLEHIAKKYEAVKEGVKEVMGGKVLEYEAKRIKREGREEGRVEGREEGRVEGREEGIRGTVSVLKELGIPIQTILVKIQEEYHLSPELSKKYL